MSEEKKKICKCESCTPDCVCECHKHPENWSCEGSEWITDPAEIAQAIANDPLLKDKIGIVSPIQPEPPKLN